MASASVIAMKRGIAINRIQKHMPAVAELVGVPATMHHIHPSKATDSKNLAILESVADFLEALHRKHDPTGFLQDTVGNDSGFVDDVADGVDDDKVDDAPPVDPTPKEPTEPKTESPDKPAEQSQTPPVDPELQKKLDLAEAAKKPAAHAPSNKSAKK